jgi:hypothetical protein
MQRRPGFARLLPLMVLTGLAAGTSALVTCDWMEPNRPAPRPVSLTDCLATVPDDAKCADVPAPFPSHGIEDCYHKRWELAAMPGRLLVGLDVRGAEWLGVDLHRAHFVGCDFRGADLRSANLRRARLWRCDLTGADLSDADLTRVDILGATYDRFTRWPAGFDPEAHGARLEVAGARSKRWAE